MSRNTPTNPHTSWYQILKSQERPVLIYQMGKVGSSALESRFLTRFICMTLWRLMLTSRSLQ